MIDITGYLITTYHVCLVDFDLSFPNSLCNT